MEVETITNPQTSLFSELITKRDSEWANLINNARWAKFILNGDFDVRFYAIYLIETYHYVVHSPKHQALVGVHMKEKAFKYIQFCYEHAQEETGHEMMALHDLISLGIEKDTFSLPNPDPSTEVFIAYLYWISTNGNPLQRLGYSFWAEDSYQYIGQLIDKVRSILHLKNNQMTFLISHASIDEKHAQEIEEMLSELCQLDDDWYSVEKVMKTSLKLQSDMLDNVVLEYLKLRNDEKSRYSFLNKLYENANQVFQ